MKKKLFFVLCVFSVMLIVGCSTAKQSDTTAKNPMDFPMGEKPDLGDEMAFPPKRQGAGGGGLGMQQVDTSWIENKIVDIPYGSVSKTQTLDIYYPNQSESDTYPVIIAIHGGGFMMGSKTGGDVRPMLEGVNHGYAVVSVNYRLSGEAVFPGAISDVKAAIRFVKANAEKYHFDTTKIALWGDSSGGNLASLAGTSWDDDTLNGDNKENLNYSTQVQAVVDWFGPIDFLQMDAQFKESGITPAMGWTSTDTSPESKYIGGNITQNTQQTERANPTNYITKDDPYFLIQHGDQDRNVPLQQSKNFAAALTAVLGQDKVVFEILPGAGHGTSEFETEENLTKVFDFLDTVLEVR